MVVNASLQSCFNPFLGALGRVPQLFVCSRLHSTSVHVTLSHYMTRRLLASFYEGTNSGFSA